MKNIRATSPGPVEVYDASNMIEAQFVCNILEDAGIAARIVGEALGAASGDLGSLTATPRVWVRSEDERRARAVVADYQERLYERAHGLAPLDEEAPPPFCYHCGQAVWPEVTPCPHCGEDLEWDTPPERCLLDE